jgi:hypothetical protein
MTTKSVLIAVITTRICTIISLHAVHSREKTVLKDMIEHALTPPLEEPPVRGSELKVLHPPVAMVASTSRVGRLNDEQLPFSGLPCQVP